MTGFLEGLAARAAGRAAEAPVRPWSGPRFLPDDLGVGTASTAAEPDPAWAQSERESIAPGSTASPQLAAAEAHRQLKDGPRTVQGEAPDRSAGDATAVRRSPSLLPDRRVDDDESMRARRERAASPATPPEHPATVRRGHPASEGDAPAPSPPRSERPEPESPRASSPKSSPRGPQQLPVRPPPEPRIEVHIGRVELRAPRPPQPPPRPAAARAGRDAHVHGFDRLATARRYVDRTPR